MSTNEALIYKGWWVNWSEGAIRGSTITLPTAGAPFLVSFLTLYVTITGSQFWKIVSFIVHQRRAAYALRDGLYIQQQAILRNVGSPTDASMKFGRIWFTWRKNARRSLIRSLPLALLALFCLGAFHASSLLVGEVTKAAGNETLIRSPNCGYWEPDSESPFMQQGFRTKVAAETFAAAAYARDCYIRDAQSLQECSVYEIPQIGWTPRNASCPFAAGVCFSSAAAVYQMDTGPIDSYHALGLNTAQGDRITYRRVTTCAPINAGLFVSNTTSNGDTILNYSLGSSPYGLGHNLTFTYNTHALQDGFGYQISSYSSDVSYQWVPQVNRADGDVSIFPLEANAVAYAAQVDDLFFAAHKPVDITQSNQESTYYNADNPVALLGCVDQHQFCTLADSLGHTECTPMTGYTQLYNSLQNTSFNQWQNATALRIYYAMYLSNMYYSVDPRGVSALRASETVSDLIQVGLPEDQWITEVGGWFNVSLAKFQQALVEIAFGPAEAPGVRINRPISGLDMKLCNLQIVRNCSQCENFSVLGIALIVAFCTVIIVLGFIIDKAVAWIQRLTGTGEDMRLQWLFDGNLQLQRMAYDRVGTGSWEGHTDEIPITKEGDVFESSLKHPSNLQFVSKHQSVISTKEEVSAMIPGDPSLV